MTTFSIRFLNSNDQPVFLQVDPWAGCYVLKKGEEIELIAPSKTNSPSFGIDEYGDTRILTLFDSSEYFVVKDGKRIHWTEYSTNCDEQ